MGIHLILPLRFSQIILVLTFPRDQTLYQLTHKSSVDSYSIVLADGMIECWVRVVLILVDYGVPSDVLDEIGKLPVV
jgi:hypothetical protein